MNFQSCFLCKIQLLMHTCFTLKKRKKILILNSSKLNLQLYPSPEKKKESEGRRGGGGFATPRTRPPCPGPSLYYVLAHLTQYKRRFLTHFIRRRYVFSIFRMSLFSLVERHVRIHGIMDVRIVISISG